MRLNPAAFDRFLTGIGQQVLWRRAYACACVSLQSGAPDPKHALCSGKGPVEPGHSNSHGCGESANHG